MEKSKVISALAGLGMLTVADTASAQNQKELASVDPGLVHEAVMCVLTAQPGKNVKRVDECYPEGSCDRRRIVIVGGGYQYTVDASKSYPNPLIVAEGDQPVAQIPLSGEVVVHHPELQIFQRPIGDQGLYASNIYRDGGGRVHYKDGKLHLFETKDNPQGDQWAEDDNNWKNKYNNNQIEQNAVVLGGNVDSFMPRGKSPDVDSTSVGEINFMYQQALNDIVGACKPKK